MKFYLSTIAALMIASFGYSEEAEPIAFEEPVEILCEAEPAPCIECIDVIPAPAEPAILALGLQRPMVLDGTLNLSTNFDRDAEVTTETASDYFETTEDGIEVKKSGLYRVEYYQGVQTGNIPCELTVVMKQGQFEKKLKRLERVKLKRGDSTELNFSKIIRVEAGEKIALKIRTLSGEVFLEGGFHSSGFTLEALKI